jgi:porin
LGPGKIRIAAVLLIIGWLSSSLLAQSSGQEVAQSARGTVSVTELISQPHHIIQNLAQDGVSFQGMFVNDWSKGTSSSETSANGFGRYSLDVSMTLDGEKLWGGKGTTGFIRLKQHLQEFGATNDGAAQIYSNIDAPSRTSLYELWVEQKLLSGRLRLKGGKIDANTEFAVVQSAGDFLNSSMGYSPTIMDFPTYPEPRLGVSVFLYPKQKYQLGAGVFETGGRGVLSLVEPGRSWKLGQKELAGRVSLGYWRRDGEIPGFDGGMSSVTQGYYSVLEQALWRSELRSGAGERRLTAYAQFGHSDGRVNCFTRHVGGGAVLQAPLARRPHDSLGTGATWVRFSSETGAGFEVPAELVLETYYKLAITRNIALVQDFQYLHNPGGLRSNPDYPVITPRVVITF